MNKNISCLTYLKSKMPANRALRGLTVLLTVSCHNPPRNSKSTTTRVPIGPRVKCFPIFKQRTCACVKIKLVQHLNRVRSLPFNGNLPKRAIRIKCECSPCRRKRACFSSLFSVLQLFFWLTLAGSVCVYLCAMRGYFLSFLFYFQILLLSHNGIHMYIIMFDRYFESPTPRVFCDGISHSRFVSNLYTFVCTYVCG